MRFVIRKRDFLASIFLFIVIILFSLMFLRLDLCFEKNILVACQFIVIGIIAAIEIIRDVNRRAFSLRMIHAFFIFMFLFCGGVSQFATDSYKWGLNPTLADIEITNYIIICWEFVFFICYSFFEQREKRIVNHRFLYKESTISRTGYYAILSMVAVLALYVASHGAAVYLNRASYSSIFTFSSQSIYLIVTTLRNGLACICLFLAAYMYQKKKLSRIMLFVSLTFVLLLLPPTGVARYITATAYGGFIIFQFRRLKEGRLFVIVLSIALLIVFPVLNAFRWASQNGMTFGAITYALGNISDNFTTSDYDSYSMVVYVMQYVRIKGCTYGMQLLGALLFFIPRSVWPSKPVGSGATVIETIGVRGYSSNVSCPIMAEGMMNFSIFGVVVFAILLAYFTSKIDEAYWGYLSGRNKHSITTIEILYPCTIPYFLFMCRGDLQSTYSFFFGIVFTMVICFACFGKRIRKGNTKKLVS